MRKNPQKLLIIVLALMFLAGSGPLLAQGSLAEYWVMTVSPSNAEAFEAAFKQHGAYRGEQGEEQSWDVFTPVTGDSLNVYVVQACCFGWAQVDKQEQWGVDNPGVMENWASTAGQYVEKYAHYFDDYDMANSNWPESGDSPRYVGVTDYYVTPAHSADFAAAKAEVSQIAINQGWGEDHHWAWSQRVGGKPVTSIVVPFDNFADMTSGETTFADFLKEHMGAEAATALMAKFTGAVRGSSYSIWRHRPDLTSGSSD